MKPRIDFGTLFMFGIVGVLLAGFGSVLAWRNGDSASTAGGAAPFAAGYPAPDSAQTQAAPIANQVPTGIPNARLAQVTGPQTWATPTLLPASARHLGVAVDLMNKSQLSLQATAVSRVVEPATDGKTLVGLVLNPPALGGTVIAIDLATGAEQKIADVSDMTYPQVSDRYVVWVDNYELNFYDRTSGQRGIVNVVGKKKHPSISGTTVVWANRADSSSISEIWGYDLASGKEFPVIQGVSSADPSISGRWVVFASSGLKAINLDTHEEITLGDVNRPLLYQYPLFAIDSPWVVWTFGADDAQPAFHLYNLDARQAQTVEVGMCNGTRPERPVISTPIVFFSGCSQYMAYDFQAGTFFSVPLDRLQAQAGGSYGWAFAKGQLVWAAESGPKGEGPAQLYTVSVVGGK